MFTGTIIQPTHIHPVLDRNKTMPVWKQRKNKIIAFAGKGGVGKTSLCGMLIQHLCIKGHTPVLAVDADPNTNLNEVLGIETEFTVSGVQQEMQEAGYNKSPVEGVSKNRYAELKINQSMAEKRGYDLLVIGRSEGKGCYCNVNGILEYQIEKIHNTYPYVVIDNEAGMEHISRGIVPEMDILILVSDCSRRGVQAAGRIAELVRELDIRPKHMGLVVNRAPGGVLNEGTMEEIKRQNLDLIEVVAKDSTVYEYDCAGKPLVQIPETSQVKQAISRIAEKLDL